MADEAKDISLPIFSPTVALHSVKSNRLWQCYPFRVQPQQAPLIWKPTSAKQPFTLVHWHHPNKPYLFALLLYRDDWDLKLKLAKNHDNLTKLSQRIASGARYCTYLGLDFNRLSEITSVPNIRLSVSF